jgi:hypothetical protein
MYKVIPWDIGRYLVKKDDKTNYLVDMESVSTKNMSSSILNLWSL